MRPWRYLRKTFSTSNISESKNTTTGVVPARADVITFPTREHRRRHRIRDASAEARTRERPWRSLRSLVTDNTANETSTTNIYIYIYIHTRVATVKKKGKKRKKERNVLLTLGHLFFFFPIHRYTTAPSFFSSSRFQSSRFESS